jgi:hypothetical protein
MTPVYIRDERKTKERDFVFSIREIRCTDTYVRQERGTSKQIVAKGLSRSAVALLLLTEGALQSIAGAATAPCRCLDEFEWCVSMGSRLRIVPLLVASPGLARLLDEKTYPDAPRKGFSIRRIMQKLLALPRICVVSQSPYVLLLFRWVSNMCVTAFADVSACAEPRGA